MWAGRKSWILQEKRSDVFGCGSDPGPENRPYAKAVSWHEFVGTGSCKGKNSPDCI
jgi:hypothetical protein